MEQRRHSRFSIHQDVRLTVLQDPEIQVSASVQNASPRGVGLAVPFPISPGVAVKLEMGDSMLLGEVIYCRSDGQTHFIGVELDQVLVGLTHLARNCRS